MITEDYVSYELAKLLKEKGFDYPCLGYWCDFENGDKAHTIYGPLENHNAKPKFTSMPTHQMVMEWLRKKGIYVYVEPYIVGEEVYYLGRVLDKNKMRLHSIDNMTSYPEAIEERIRYSLENLI